ncbi:uncharacterized protein DMAD_12252 [Drosophila madeirensis]|uniref:Uncharacterized protein n=1 Tax=Drosophila madeirensis TaxID=30013 RepID=A0AAU9FG71_DROMD
MSTTPHSLKTDVSMSHKSDLKSHLSKAALHQEFVPPQDLDISAIMYKYYLEEYRKYTPEERDSRLATFDAMDMLRTIEQIHNDVATMKLENYIMVEFLEKNDPKLLIGLRQRRTSILKRFQNKQRASFHGSQRMSSRQSSSKRSIPLSTSHLASLSPTATDRRRGTEYKLNFKAKAEMAEKRAAEVEKRVVDIERNGKTS